MIRKNMIFTEFINKKYIFFFRKLPFIGKKNITGTFVTVAVIVALSHNAKAFASFLNKRQNSSIYVYFHRN